MGGRGFVRETVAPQSTNCVTPIVSEIGLVRNATRAQTCGSEGRRRRRELGSFGARAGIGFVWRRGGIGFVWRRGENWVRSAPGWKLGSFAQRAGGIGFVRHAASRDWGRVFVCNAMRVVKERGARLRPLSSNIVVGSRFVPAIAAEPARAAAAEGKPKKSRKTTRKVPDEGQLGLF